MHKRHAFRPADPVVERRLELRPDEAAPVPAAEGTTVVCLKGPLWLTQEGEWRDFILIEGMRFVSGSAGRIVVSALDTAGQAIVRVPLPGSAERPRPGVHIDAEVIRRAAQKAGHARAAEIPGVFRGLASRLVNAAQRFALGMFTRGSRRPDALHD